MKLKDFINEARTSLSRIYPEDEARALVSRLCAAILGVSPQKHILDPRWEIPNVASVSQALARLEAGEPLQYVLGKADFYGREFKVSPAVLIPRPETEELVDHAVRSMRCHAAPVRVLDICTGSGCIAWSLAAELVGSSVTALDISDAALAVASSQDVDCKNPPSFLHADALHPEGLRSLGQFDLIVSNPPYVMERERAQMRPNVLEHEPGLALFVPDDDPLLFYRSLAVVASSQLAPKGFGIVEINEALGQETASLFVSAGLADVRILQDLNGKDRFVAFSHQ